MYAVIKTGGKQYRVSQGDEIFVEKIDSKDGEKIEFTDVLMVNNKIGTPNVEGAKVVGEVVKHGKAKKITIFKFKAKKDYRKKQGHRQPYTKIKITDIQG